MSSTLANRSFPTMKRRSFPLFERDQSINTLPPELKSRIAYFCDIPTLVGLLHDRRWEAFVLLELELSFLALLAKVTPDPTAFRKMMRDTNTIISGSTALHFLLRQPHTWSPGDVDLIVSPTYFGTVVHFLSQLPGACVEHCHKTYYGYPSKNVGFSKVLKIRTSQGRFDVIKSQQDSPFHPLPFYWGTHVMNALTADAFICPYPSLTFQLKGTIVRNPLQKPALAAVAKYQLRGFTLSEYGAHALTSTTTCAETVVCPRRDRYFGDAETLMITFSNQQTDHGISISTAWRLGGNSCTNGECFLPAELKVCTVYLERDGRSKILEDGIVAIL